MMEPTNAELIFWIVLAVAGLLFAFYSFALSNSPIEMDEYKTRDINRRENEWERMLRR